MPAEMQHQILNNGVDDDATEFGLDAMGLYCTVRRKENNDAGRVAPLSIVFRRLLVVCF